MVKKLFALASVSALAGLVSAVGAAGCTTTTEVQGGDTADSGKTDGGGKVNDTKPKDAGTTKTDGSTVDDDAGTEPEEPEEETVGKACKTTADCNVENALNDNKCSKGLFKDGDIFGTPYCISACTLPAKVETGDDFLCDGQAGVCYADGPGEDGTCYGMCAYNSTTVTAPCAGTNKCVPYQFLGDGANLSILGICYAACTKDADCTGTAGQKCEVETGICVTTPTTYAKSVGEACTRKTTGTPDCNCVTVGGQGANKDKGICTSVCVTGAAGDAACNSKETGWKCTTLLPAKDSKGNALFTDEPDDVYGQCALPCTVDGDCTAYGTTAGVAAKCNEYAGGKYCDLAEPTN
ncbi:MAG TPA: hypothetical protein VM925_27180 [Labilithrix sp.]|nr:hypothetical protein [Labilithrix sp.]